MSGQVASMQQPNLFGNQGGIGLNMPQIGMDMSGGQAPYMLAAPKLEVPTIGATGFQPTMGGMMEVDGNFGMQPVSLDMNPMGLGGNFVFYPEADTPLVADYEPINLQEEEVPPQPKSPEKKTRDATVVKKADKKKSQGFCCF